MSHRGPARTPARSSSARRSGLLVVAVAGLALLLAATAFAGAPHLLNGTVGTHLSPDRSPRGGPAASPLGGAPPLASPSPSLASPSQPPARSSGQLASPSQPPAAIAWPQRGQAAYALGDAPPEASPNEQPVPIASLAKVMTAYLTLKDYPLIGNEDGFTIIVTAAQAQAEAEDAAQRQSVVAVRAGEQLTERQLLEGLLVPSGDNIAWMLATQVGGSDAAFLADMNAEARALGMSSTTYTDPSGFYPSTVSTAADQLRLFQRAMSSPAFDQIVSMPSVTLPIAGTLRNFDPLIAEGYDGKTGSDLAAGGCLAFFTHVTVGGSPLTLAGVVMGQGEGRDTSALLAAAGEAAEQLVDSATVAAR
ncbi:MAG TPA: D-alanyl-D-alanine carboxypeptidase [Actinomycetota bacterium]|nr:D-alanyl-D-alanine carboxypeptidase [Actinomycetota bacterium]